MNAHTDIHTCMCVHVTDHSNTQVHTYNMLCTCNIHSIPRGDYILPPLTHYIVCANSDTHTVHQAPLKLCNTPFHQQSR